MGRKTEEKSKEDNLEESKAAQEDKKLIAICQDHKKDLTKDFWESEVRSMFMRVASNLFFVYMNGKGFISPTVICKTIEDEKGTRCPFCYWDELEKSTHYFFDSVLRVEISRSVKKKSLRSDGGESTKIQ